MRFINRKFSIRALVGLITISACAVAFAVSYGRNFLWALTHFDAPRHTAFVETQISTEMLNGDFVRCDFLNLSFDLPSAMAGSAKVNKNGSTRFLEFSNGDRQLRVVLSSNAENRAIFGALPALINEETTAQLLHRIYAADTHDFSLNMSAEQLLLHEWTLTYRDIFAYERFLNQIAFDDRSGVHVLVLSSDPKLSPIFPKMKRLISWSAPDGTDGGLIYVLDAEGATDDWSDRIAASIRMRHASQLTKFDFATATDSEIIAEVKTASVTDEPSVERKSPSQSDSLINQSRRLH